MIQFETGPLKVIVLQLFLDVLRDETSRNRPLETLAP